jgi:hypothetical protein
LDVTEQLKADKGLLEALRKHNMHKKKLLLFGFSETNFRILDVVPTHDSQEKAQTEPGETIRR